MNTMADTCDNDFDALCNFSGISELPHIDDAEFLEALKEDGQSDAGSADEEVLFGSSQQAKPLAEVKDEPEFKAVSPADEVEESELEVAARALGDAEAPEAPVPLLVGKRSSPEESSTSSTETDKVEKKEPAKRRRPIVRPSYKCGRCGQMKKGHRCPIKERLAPRICFDGKGDVLISFTELLKTAAAAAAAGNASGLALDLSKLQAQLADAQAGTVSPKFVLADDAAIANASSLSVR